jgi:K+-sensing histidine kinase KdpD
MPIAATLCYDYFFIPPAGTFNVTDYRDWIALTAFLMTSIVGSTLSVRARRQAEESRRQRREAEQLYDLSQMLISGGTRARAMQCHTGGHRRFRRKGRGSFHILFARRKRTILMRPS